MEKDKKIPSATIRRLSMYRQHLMEMQKLGRRTISSEELARAARVNSAQLRKDLSYFGRFGVRGVGYSVDGLLEEISNILGLQRPWKVCVLGGGRVGKAIVMSGHLEHRGYLIEAVFDSREEMAGRELGKGLLVYHVSRVREVLARKEVSLCMITEDIPGINDCIGLLLGAGIKGFLSLVPIGPLIPPDVPIQHMDFTILLDTLAYTLTHNGVRAPQNLLESDGMAGLQNNYTACAM